ncbi:hypothetical protein K457DRAFT_140736 [Linnemannia elongata AG-77]|uniref:Uncharacterized protein n=1 Tax=Linnemannia elongata AG-77 TaxID=1314771 RepID=A0A197JM02_9FUNG|nr:hypothetical protein K457DRAFT_140736 [Linnemannia elongata AG-77]
MMGDPLSFKTGSRRLCQHRDFEGHRVLKSPLLIHPAHLFDLVTVLWLVLMLPWRNENVRRTILDTMSVAP